MGLLALVKRDPASLLWVLNVRKLRNASYQQMQGRHDGAACSAGIWREKQDSGFEASLGSPVSDTLSQKRFENLGIMAHTCNPSTQENEAGG